MAWKYKRSGIWWIGTRANGRLIAKSTGERNEKKAAEKLAALRSMEQAQKANRLNREFFEALTGAHIEVIRLFEALDTWLKETTNPNTRNSYANVAKQLRAAMPHNPILAEVTQNELRSFLAGIRAEKRASTANLAIKCTKALFARFKGALKTDPTDGIPNFKKEADAESRETFTPDQIRRLMAVASPFWRCAAALAFYSGLRLSDVAMLKVGQLNGDRLVVSHTVKTGAEVRVRLPAPVVAMIRAAIPPDAGADAYIWPDEAKHAAANNVTNLSGQFTTLLINAGIRKATDGAGNGLTGRRNVSPLVFHSLRHGFISALANAGVNQQVVKALVGHASDRINDAYTHVGEDTLDKAVALLPDITKPEVTK